MEENVTEQGFASAWNNNQGVLKEVMELRRIPAYACNIRKKEPSGKAAWKDRSKREQGVVP